MSSMPGYYRHPTVFDSQVVFVSEDDLWIVPLEGGVARRLTSGLGACSNPVFSPDGQWIAFSSAEEGHREVYVIPAQGGAFQRLTYLGAVSTVTGWLSDSEVLFRTDYFSANRVGTLAKVSLKGGMPESLKLGPVTNMAIHGQSHGVVVERNSHRPDPAHWKRYRGGTAGKFYYATNIDSEFKPFLTGLNGNLANPLWVKDRLYFLSDHEDVGNIYSCDKSGGDLRRHTGFKNYYARNLSSDGKHLVFHVGADLHCMSAETGSSKKIDIEYASQGTQKQRKFVACEEYLEHYHLSPDGKYMCLTSRGQVAYFGNWRGPVYMAGQKPGVRYRLGTWLGDGHKLTMVSDEGGEEHLEVYDTQTRERQSFVGLDIGRVIGIKASPKSSECVALSNHRSELILVNFKSNSASVLAKNDHGPMGSFNWSPDGQFLAFAKTLRRNCSVIQVIDVANKTAHTVTQPLFQDSDPVFDGKGQCLYFLSNRELNPRFDALQFELGFQESILVCAVTLQKGTTSPFLPGPDEFKEDDKDSSGKESDDDSDEKSEEKDAKAEALQIDFEGIQERLIRVPVPPANYGELFVTKDRIFVSSWPIEGMLGQEPQGEADQAKGQIHLFDLKKQKLEEFHGGVSSFEICQDQSKMVVETAEGLRVVSTDEKPPESDSDEEFGEEKGWIDLSRMKVLVEPQAEWKQMLHEVWRLQRDQFWREDMSKVKWENVYQLYEPLVERVGSRAEFGDLVWEMQGELGTSHAYDIGGDYRSNPKYHIGLLGAHFAWDENAKGYRIDMIIEGDSWNPAEASPLKSPGVLAQVGDVIMAIQGQRVTQEWTPNFLLMNLAGQEVEITLLRKGSQEPENHRVKTLSSESKGLYRQWVESNRRYVHERSKGRVGYVHIPNMGAEGFSEFHRYYLQEFDFDALIVDVRFNGGGMVSSLLLEKLARKRIGLGRSRWWGEEPYPEESPAGPMVALTNEFAGSDGDIFSHAFKLMDLGPLLGTRTWGGVIGIWPRHELVDGGITTQPEFSFWFKDVGWGVENYGTDPDIFVDSLPHHYRREEDPQLDRSIKEALSRLEAHPPFRPDPKL